MNLIHKSDFTKGKKITKSEIAEWHERILENLQKEGTNYSSWACGNSIIIGSKDIVNGSITIYEVVNGYKKYEYDLPNNEQEDERSVATNDDSSTGAGNQKK